MKKFKVVFFLNFEFLPEQNQNIMTFHMYIEI